jgi:glycosyltransferase involved in cell wall biosynthesis
MPSRVTIILATYEFSPALELLFRALAEQKCEPCEVIVADDGSGDDVAATVERWRRHFDLVHVWQPDAGIRKARALNLAVLAARGDYLLFLDADCLPRRTFLRSIRRAALPGWFLATKRIDLTREFSSYVLERQLPIWRWPMVTWLSHGRREVRRPGYLMSLRDRRRPWRPAQPDFVPTDNAYGFCLGVSRADYERVNGYDARFIGRANEDADLVVRLRRIGLRCGWPGPGATMFHLWHPRPAGRPNEPLFFETRDSERIEAVVGLRELAAELVDAQFSANRVGGSSESAGPVKR